MVNALPIFALGGIAAYAWARARDQDDSTREDEPEVSDYEGVDVYDELVDLIASSLGWPYYYGRGTPQTPWSDGPRGVDCSGYVQMFLRELGELDANAADRNALGLANAADAVPVGQQQPGDFAYYNGHVMMVAGPPGADGHSPVIGASGGDSGTYGDDPNARIKIFRSALYRGDFVTYCRLKEG